MKITMILAILAILVTCIFSVLIFKETDLRAQYNNPKEMTAPITNEVTSDMLPSQQKDAFLKTNQMRLGTTSGSTQPNYLTKPGSDTDIWKTNNAATRNSPITTFKDTMRLGTTSGSIQTNKKIQPETGNYNLKNDITPQDKILDRSYVTSERQNTTSEVLLNH